MAADEGYSDATIAALLGHSQRNVTARHYIRRPDAALIAAADKTAARIATSMAGTMAEVVPLHRPLAAGAAA
jgi:integrase